MAPGEKHILWAAKDISKTMINYATATANPSFQDGRDLGDLDDVSDTDPSEVAELVAEAALGVAATVYPGHDGGASCGSNKAVESVEDYSGKIQLQIMFSL